MTTITYAGMRRVIINTDDRDKAEFLVLECARLNTDPFSMPIRCVHDFDRFTGRHRVTIWEVKP